MKNLTLISFVGVDNYTNLDEVWSFQSSIPCEFSVLFSESKSLTKDKRYPSLGFCKDFLSQAKMKGAKGSLHLCGNVIDKYLDQDSQIMDLCKDAYRIQLNLNIANYNDYISLSDSIYSIIKRTDHSIILQMNKTKAKFMEIFLQNVSGPISILHDSSGGFGREISVVEPPNDFHLTGYAGGLSSENVVKVINLINMVNPDNHPYYLDMESKIREDNYFSIEKCRKVVRNIEQM